MTRISHHPAVIPASTFGGAFRVGSGLPLPPPPLLSPLHLTGSPLALAGVRGAPRTSGSSVAAAWRRPRRPTSKLRARSALCVVRGAPSNSSLPFRGVVRAATCSPGRSNGRWCEAPLSWLFADQDRVDHLVRALALHGAPLPRMSLTGAIAIKRRRLLGSCGSSAALTVNNSCVQKERCTRAHFNTVAGCESSPAEARRLQA